MSCVICGAPVKHRNGNTCSQDCRKIRDSKLAPEEYWRRQCQIPAHSDEHTNELNDDRALQNVVRQGMNKDL